MVTGNCYSNSFHRVHNTIAVWNLAGSWTQHLSSSFRYSSGLTEPKSHKKFFFFKKQAKIDIWKFSPKDHILFYKVFFDRKHSKLAQANTCGRNSLRLPRHSFFPDFPLFKIWDWRLSPQQIKGLILWTCHSHYFAHGHFLSITIHFRQICRWGNGVEDLTRMTLILS